MTLKTVPIHVSEFERHCPACEGTGWIANPKWLSWKPGESHPDEDEELWCVECEGSGVQLTDAGRAMAAFVQRWQARP